jgi:streptogramin lyase
MYRQHLLAITASGLVGCAGGSHALPSTPSPEGGSPLTQLLSSSRFPAANSFTEYLLPSAGAKPFAITEGADGNMWFTEANSDKVAKITATGMITEYPISTAGSPGYIVAGPSGHLWFTEHFAPMNGSVRTATVIDEMAVNGKIVKQYNVPTFAGLISGLAAGPDGTIWYTDPIGNSVGKLTPAGTATMYPLANGTGPGNIASGPGGNLWFTENFWSGRVGSRIAKITTAGKISEYQLATNAGPDAVAATHAGNRWFTEAGTNKIGKVTTAGTVTDYTVPTPNSSLFGITESSDGNHWFTENGGNKIGRITAAGAITEYAVPTPRALPEDIAAKSDGTLWFTEAGGNKIGTIKPVSL